MIWRHSGSMAFNSGLVGWQEEETDSRSLQFGHPILDGLAVMNGVVVQGDDEGSVATVALPKHLGQPSYPVDEAEVGQGVVLALAVAPDLEDQARSSRIEGRQGSDHVDPSALWGFVWDDLPLTDASPPVSGGHGGRKARLVQEGQIDLTVPGLIF